MVALLLAILLPFARPSWALLSLLFTLDHSELQDGLARPLLGPSLIAHGGYAVLERHSQLKLPRMRIVAGSRFDALAVRQTQAFMSEVLRLRRPFSVEWDPRRITWPQLSPAMMSAVHEWVEVNVHAWDTHVQAHAVIVSNPLARSFARFLVQMFLPPQPVGIVAHEAAAHDFAKDCCHKVRSFVKKTYADRDARLAMGGARGAHVSASGHGETASAEAFAPRTADLVAAAFDHSLGSESRELALICP